METLLPIEGPVFVWNILHILCFIALKQQSQLYGMLLFYATNLARICYVASHPVVQLLNNLQMLSVTWDHDKELFHVAVLEQGWSLNANLPFGKVDIRLMGLYYGLAWNSSLLKASPKKIKQAKATFAQLAASKPAVSLLMDSVQTIAEPNAPCLVDLLRKNVPVDIDRLRGETIALVRQRAKLNITNDQTRQRLLAGLIKCRLIEDTEPFYQPSFDQLTYTELDIGEALVRAKLFALHIRCLAYVIQILMDTDLKMGGPIDEAIERLKTAITLRTYAQNPIAPQVAHEMCLLEDFLL